MPLIPCAFHIDYDPGAEKQPPTVPMQTMHEYLSEIAEFIQGNCSTEEIEMFQPDVLKRVAAVLKKRHEEGWSLEGDYEQQLECHQEPLD